MQKHARSYCAVSPLLRAGFCIIINESNAQFLMVNGISSLWGNFTASLLFVLYQRILVMPEAISHRRNSRHRKIAGCAESHSVSRVVETRKVIPGSV